MYRTAKYGLTYRPYRRMPLSGSSAKEKRRKHPLLGLLISKVNCCCVECITMIAVLGGVDSPIYIYTLIRVLTHTYAHTYYNVL